MEDMMAEVFTEEDLKAMKQASAFMDECNTRILEKLVVLDHMETRARLEMDELDAMVAKLRA
jgi:hypothetical protein